MKHQESDYYMNNIELDYRKILKVVILAILGYWLLDHYSEVFGFISWLISILMPFTRLWQLAPCFFCNLF